MKLHHLFSYQFVPGKVYNVPDAPNSVLWDICYLCNQKCKFCYNSDEDVKKPLPDYNRTRKILEILCAWGVKEIIYLGGEPTILPYLNEILELAKNKGISQRLISNGAFVTESLARKLVSLDVEVGISLHGINGDIHDQITQTPGSFMKALQAISILEDSGAKWYLQYTPMCDEETFFSSIENLRNRFPSLRLVDVNRLMPQGRGSDKAELYQNEESLWKCISDIPKLKDAGIDVSIESIPHCWIRKRAKQAGLPLCCVDKILKSIRPCYMAINQVAMDDYGRLKLCPGGRACTESILQVPPRDLWKNAEPFAQRRQFLFLPKCCINFANGTACKYFYNCGGGCKMTTPTIYSSSPRCDFLISS